MIINSTKVYKNFQTSIPKEIRKHFNVNENTIVEWMVTDDGDLEVRFRDKVTLKDLLES